MAGAGYKLFNTGDVLTAAQVNTYLQEQAVMVFANAAARTTALSGVLAEGMITYLKDTDAVEKYDGSSWVSVSGSSVPTSYGYTAGKNKIINGDMRIWQRGTTFNSAANGSFTADRFQIAWDSSPTVNASQQSFTPGTAPVAGYESPFFLRVAETATSSSTVLDVRHRVEDVRTFAGQTATISFWAKADSARNLTLIIIQDFGSGGSTAVDVTPTPSTFSLTTSWQRFSATMSVPSISGKTIGTGSNLAAFFRNSASATLVFDIWGVQIEAGSSATAFQTATGTLAGELAACQRYFYRANNAGVTDEPIFTGAYWSTTAFFCSVPLPVQMRTQPSLTANNPTNFAVFANSTNASATAISLDQASPNIANLNLTTAAKTAGWGGWVQTTNANASLDFSSEL